MTIYTIRTTVGKENIVVDSITKRIKNKGLPIKSLLHPAELKGYIFIEGDYETIDEAASGITHVRGIIRKPISIAEIKKFLETKKVEIKLLRGNIVEVIGGPFKGEKGKVARIDEAKGVVTIELLEAAIPIPITVDIETVRVIDKGESDGKDNS